MIHQLVYNSFATQKFTDEVIRDILVVSRAHNMQYGITGLLLIKDNAMLQIIEGRKSDVKTLFGRIRNDTRHHNITTLLEHSIQTRQFPEWSMGFHSLTHKEEDLPDYLFKLSKETLNRALPQTAGQQLDQFIQTYSKVANL